MVNVHNSGWSFDKATTEKSLFTDHVTRVEPEGSYDNLFYPNDSSVSC